MTTPTQIKAAAPRKVMGVVLEPFTMAHEITLQRLGVFQPGTPINEIFMGEILLAWETCQRDTRALERFHADDRKIAWFIHICGRLLLFFWGHRLQHKLRVAMWDHITEGRQALFASGGLE